MTGSGSDRSGILWSGRLGRASAEVREADGRRVLRIGARSTVVDDRTRVVHRSGRFALSRRVVVLRPDQPVFTHRYRLPWRLTLAPYLEAGYDRWSAEADDPGLGLVEVLGGTDDWR
ncbi:hypothetical protein [Streptomyces sp. NPDC015350]|uniref:hypothetical protein n=1 Tax=Streptomyces sp. NPDC015350 TaxID=3364955 RepID=UPI0037029B43